MPKTLDAKDTQPVGYFKHIFLHSPLHFFFLSGSLERRTFIRVLCVHSGLGGGSSEAEASNLNSDFELQISGDLLCTEIIIKKINSLATR